MKIIRTARKTLAIQVKNGELIVRAPLFTFRTTIEKFVKKHRAWIEKKLQQSKKVSPLSELEIKKLKKEAKNFIPKRVEELASEHGITYNNIRITSARTRWGSCSSKKNLSFSYRLIQVPYEVIDYVIIHELAHLKHMNHSKKFWSHVEGMMSDYKEKEKWLKKHGGSIG
jgi:predicted metal-dependent hydrolase